MIRFEHVTFSYSEVTAPVLDDVDVEIAEGELCVVVGTTGSGKSTLLRGDERPRPARDGWSARGRRVGRRALHPRPPPRVSWPT